MDKFLMDGEGHLSRNPNYNPKSNIMETSYKLVNFIKSLDDDGIEIFIRVGKETGNITAEEKFRELLYDIKNN